MKILEFMQEDNGGLSNIRLLVAFIIVCIMGTWTYVSIAEKALAPLDWQIVGTLIGALLAKAWQKGKEATDETVQK